ncbi:hypothetical protein CVIRNUC_000801 [Coccomyxa viridis]|uniref:Amino acid transporter transmembrane domain-containing protein n=1 Tax=Coccomyxa viridis TaxID=1274662 RepID=A0AAV1HVC4_9CHLO|nr:hypothetical protein CVIRNUC_000801 [Coccomyxa viridis]
MLSGYSRDADGKVEVSTGSRMPLRHQLGLSPVRETESAPPQPRAVYQRPLKTVSAPTIGEEPEEMFRLPSNSFFPSNPWPDKEVEGAYKVNPILTRMLGGDAGSRFDGWLLTVSSQIGQIMLTMPNAMAKMGLIPAIPLAIFIACMSLWSMKMLICLYVARRSILIVQKQWIGEDGVRSVTQYHDVMGAILGKFAKGIVMVVIVISLFGTCLSQIVASSSDAYYIHGHNGPDKRTWVLIFGAIMMLTPLLPTFRHFRIINFIGFFTSTFTTWYIVIQSGVHGITYTQMNLRPRSLQEFYVGISVLVSAFGGHAVALEIMDSMFKPEQYGGVYLGAFFYIFSLTLPHSIAANLAFPHKVLLNGNVYGAMPASHVRSLSICLMLIHQICAFAYYSAPLYYITEKALRVHHKPFYIRVPCRYPVALLIWFCALLAPYYGTLNALIGACTSPCIAFIFPALAFTWYFRKPERRKNASHKPPEWMRAKWLGGENWTFCFILNYFMIAIMLVNGTGFGIVFSIKQIISDVHNFSLFPACFQC